MSVQFQNNLGSTQTTTTVSTVQQRPFVIEQGELEEAETEIVTPISYAETTRIFIDETDRKALQSYGIRQIKKWIGKDLAKAMNGRVISISIHDARMINLKAEKQIIKLSAKNIERFTIDPIIRDRLKHVNLGKACVELGFPTSDLIDIKIGRIQTIGKEHAEKYNDYFKQLSGLPQAEIFDSNRILQLALVEPISGIEKKFSEQTRIAIEDEHRKVLDSLPDREKLCEWVGRKFFSMRQAVQTISVKNAVLIHKISGKTIFTFNKDAVVKIPILPAHLVELERLIKKLKEEGKKLDIEIRRKTTVFKQKNQICIDRETAEKINSCVGKVVFDFGSILVQAVQEAEAEAEMEEMEFSPLSKKPRRDSTSSTDEDSSVPNSKKRRTDDEGKKTETAITAAAFDYKAATSLQMLSASDELDGQQKDSQLTFTVPSSSTRVTDPQEPEKFVHKSKFALSFLLN